MSENGVPNWKHNPILGLTTAYKVEIALLEDILGTVAKDPDVYESYILTKAPEDQPQGEAAEELATLPEPEGRGETGFHMARLSDEDEDLHPCLLNYVIKGFFKSACGALWKTPGSLSTDLRAYKKAINRNVFVTPRMIPFWLSGPTSTLARPLRAQTAQGERVTVVRSDTVPAGSALKFTVDVIEGNVGEGLLLEWLHYGRYMGLGQWRNAGWGTFELQAFEKLEAEA